MRQEKVKQLIKLLETGNTVLDINDILYGLKRLKNFVSAGFAIRGAEVFRVYIRGTFAYLDLMATYTDSYQVGLVYKGQSFILSEATIDRSSVSAFYKSTETAVLKAEELIKSLDEQKDTEAGEAEINAICKAIDVFQKKYKKIPVWAKWIAIDARLIEQHRIENCPYCIWQNWGNLQYNPATKQYEGNYQRVRCDKLEKELIEELKSEKTKNNKN